MSRGDSVLSVYSDARTEYTKQLSVFLVPAYFQFYVDLLETSRQTMAAEPKRALWQFQTYLNEIHDWNMEKVRHEIQTIQSHCGCDYLEDLLTAVFIAHTKVLTAIRLSTNQKKVEIHIPKIDHFLFKVLCETSKLLWSSTYLFRDNISGMEKQQNYRQVEQLLHEGMLQAVRSLVPVKSILKDFVHQGQEEEEDKEDKEEEDPQEQKEQKEQAEKAEKEKAEKEKAEKEKAEKAQVEKAEKAQVEKAEKAQVEKAERAQVEKAERAQAEKEQEKESNVLEPSDPFEESADATDPPTIVVNDKPNVRFGQFHAMFDSQDGDQSELVYDEGDVSEVPDQGIAVTLEDPDSFDLSAAPESVDDYEEL
jgi:outer membrane biosynthesis protein TonB